MPYPGGEGGGDTGGDYSNDAGYDGEYSNGGGGEDVKQEYEEGQYGGEESLDTN